MESQENAKPLPPTSVVDLNVGGQLYTTTLGTLTKDPSSLLTTMFSGSQRTPKDSRGRYFIDRDGVLFRYVLDFLRNLRLTLPDGFNELERLLAEAEYFKVSAMKEALAKETKSRTSVERAKKKTSGYLSVCVRGTYAFGRDGVADVKFRKLQRILVCGNVALARDVFGDSLNETRDPAREEIRYTNRFYLKYNHLEKAFDQLAEKGFQMVTSCAGGAGGRIKVWLEAPRTPKLSLWQYSYRCTFDLDDSVWMFVVRSISANWGRDGDVGTTSGMPCVDKMRNGLRFWGVEGRIGNAGLVKMRSRGLIGFELDAGFVELALFGIQSAFGCEFELMNIVKVKYFHELDEKVFLVTALTPRFTIRLTLEFLYIIDSDDGDRFQLSRITIFNNYSPKGRPRYALVEQNYIIVCHTIKERGQVLDLMSRRPKIARILAYNITRFAL
ncbi:BTB POZ domain-containing KCTD16, partial [Paramuricea clavata]